MLKFYLKLKNFLPLHLLKNIIASIIGLFFKNGFYKNINYLDQKFKIKLDLTNGTVDNLIFYQGVISPEHLKFIKDNLKENDVVLDIGANIGFYSLFFSKVISEKGKVISFEPVKKMYNQFLDSIDKNNTKNIILYNLGCGEKNEILNIIKDTNHYGGSSIIAHNIKERIEDKKQFVKEEIEIIKLDDFLISEQKIDFIKIDVEGYEYEVLKGMTEILKKFKPKISMEFSIQIYGLEKAKNIINLLINLGYNIKELGTENLITINTPEYLLKNKISQIEIFCW